MPNELERTLAELIKPKPVGGGNETVERLVVVADGVTLADTMTVTIAAPERRVGFARANYTEAS